MSVGIFFFFVFFSFFNGCVRRTGSSCQPSKCEEDDGYARKPRRQRKAAVRSGFPTRHWLILPLGERVRAPGRRVCLNGFSSSSISWRNAQRRRGIKDPARFGGERCATPSPSKNEHDGKDEAKFLRNTTGRDAPVAGCHRGCSEVYLGNSTPPSASFQELVTSSQSQLTYKTRKNVSHWWFFDPNVVRAKARPTEIFSSRIKLECVPAVKQ